MGRALRIAATVTLLVVGLVVATAGSVTAADDTTWFFSNSGDDTTGYSTSFVASYVGESYSNTNYFMSREVAGSGGVSIGAGWAATWIADEVAAVDTSFPAGSWEGNLAILGEDGGTCCVEIGKWGPGDGGEECFTACGSGTFLDFARTAGIGGHCDNPFTVSPGGFDLGHGERLACRITCIRGSTDIHCGGGDDYYGHCCIRCPNHGPVNPVPELPTVALLGIGLVGMAGIGGLVVLRRRSEAR